ncbi:MAG: insulinase family protein [bacterium]|nr:insulinase family protein [bacterium]
MSHGIENVREKRGGSGTPGRRLVVRVRRIAGVPIVAARVWLRGGARVEDIPGQALISGRLLAEGSRTRSWDQIATAAEDRGMVIESFGSYEALGVAIDALADDWQLALAWLAELMLEPAFPPERFEWLRRQAAGELESMLDKPEVRTGLAFLGQLYRPHPYSRPLQGDRESLMRLNAGDCAAFHRRALGWGGLVVVTGDIDEAAVRRRVDELFGDLDGEAVPMPPVAPPVGLEAPRLELTAGPRSGESTAGNDQTHLYAGHLTIPRNHLDVPALAVLGVVLGAGAGMSGRLPERIREKEALAYAVDVSATAGAGLDPGRLVAYVGTSPRTCEQAERAVREELERLVGAGLEEKEFEEARSYLLGHDPFRRETARQWAEVLAEAGFYGMKTDRPEWIVEVLRALTRQEVEAVARRWIRPGEIKVTIGRPG